MVGSVLDVAVVSDQLLGSVALVLLDSYEYMALPLTKRYVKVIAMCMFVCAYIVMTNCSRQYEGQCSERSRSPPSRDENGHFSYGRSLCPVHPLSPSGVG